MPFNYESIEELRRRERLTKSDLSRKISEFAKKRGLEIKVTRITQWNWENEKPNSPNPRAGLMDLLHEFAYSLGHFDLDFYKKPDPSKYQSGNNQQQNNTNP